MLREEDDSIKIIIDGKDLEVNIRRSKRARRVSMRVDHRGRAEVVLPYGVAHSHANNIVMQNLSWLINKVRETEMHKHKHKHAKSIPVLGELCNIEHSTDGNSFSVSRHGNIIEVVGSSEETREVLLVEYLKNLLLEEVKRIVIEFSVKHELKYSGITLCAATSKWGSCKSDGTLSFNWRLVFAPKDVVRYLVAHEMAHLKERNHGPRFWRLVDKLFPDNPPAILWLKREGSKLHHIFEKYK